jgi:hypothetical protein
MYARSLCDSVILGHCFGLTMTSVPAIATCSISVLNRNNVSISRGKYGSVHNETKVEENRSAQFRVTTVVTTILLFHVTLCATSNIRQWHFRIFQFQETDFMQVVSSVYDPSYRLYVRTDKQYINYFFYFAFIYVLHINGAHKRSYFDAGGQFVRTPARQFLNFKF